MTDVSAMWSELGAVGFLVVGLAFVTIYLFRMFVRGVKVEQVKNDELTESYMAYIKNESQELRTIIKLNVEINAKLIQSLVNLENAIIESNKSSEKRTDLMTKWMNEKK